MAWTLVQQSAAQTTNGTNTLPAPSTQGNLLSAVVTNGSATALSPPAGWTTLVSVVNGTLSESYIFVYYNNPGGLSSFTFTGGSGAISVSIMEHTCPFVSLVTFTSSTGSTTAGAVAAVAPAQGAGAKIGDLIIMGAEEHLLSASAITWTKPGALLQCSGLVVTSAADHGWAGYNLSNTVNGASAYNVTSSVASTSANGWTGVIATFSQPSPYISFAGTIASGSTSYAETISANTKAGDGVLVIATGGGTGVVSGVTDSKGNTYAALQSQTTTTPRLFIYYMTAGFTALIVGDTVTVSYSSAPSSNGTIQVIGVPLCPLVDVAPAIATGTSTAPSVGATPTGAPEIAVGVFCWANAGGVGSALSYTLLVQTVPSGAAYATVTYNASLSSGVLTTNSATIVSAFWNAAVVIMKPSAAAALPPSLTAPRSSLQSVTPVMAGAAYT